VDHVAYARWQHTIQLQGCWQTDSPTSIGARSRYDRLPLEECPQRLQKEQRLPSRLGVEPTRERVDLSVLGPGSNSLDELERVPSHQRTQLDACHCNGPRQADQPFGQQGVSRDRFGPHAQEHDDGRTFIGPSPGGVLQRVERPDVGPLQVVHEQYDWRALSECLAETRDGLEQTHPRGCLFDGGSRQVGIAIP